MEPERLEERVCETDEIKVWSKWLRDRVHCKRRWERRWWLWWGDTCRM